MFHPLSKGSTFQSCGALHPPFPALIFCVEIVSKHANFVNILRNAEPYFPPETEATNSLHSSTSDKNNHILTQTWSEQITSLFLHVHMKSVLVPSYMLLLLIKLFFPDWAGLDFKKKDGRHCFKQVMQSVK